MKNLLFGLLAILVFNSVNAQEVETNEDGSWYTLINKFKVSNKLYFLNVAQWRQVDFASTNRIFLVAPSVNYKLTNKVTAGAGYMYLNYNQAGIRKPGLDDEERIWQHVTLSSTFGKAKMSQRFMFEERFKIKNNGSKAYANRFRYRVNLDFNLFKLSNGKYVLGKLSEEMRIKFASGINEPEFDQNNFSALVGYKVLDNAKLYLGYGRNYYNGSSGYWGDHLMHVVFSYGFDFSKKK